MPVFIGRLLGAGHEAAPFARISSLKHHSSPEELGKADLAKAARPVCARPALALSPPGSAGHALNPRASCVPSPSSRFSPSGMESLLANVLGPRETGVYEKLTG